MRTPVVAVALVALVSVGGSDALSWPKWGRCPPMAVEQQFDVESYLGTWYEQAGYNTDMYQGDARCVSADYLPTDKSGVISVNNRAISQRTNKPVSINGTAKLSDPNKDEGKLDVTFRMFYGLIPVTAGYWVLGTDYDTYSLVYSCHNFFFIFHYDAAWALSRSRTFDTEEDKEEFYTSINNLLWANRIPVHLTQSNQKDCDV